MDETTVFKYPKTPGDEETLAMLAVEAQILTTIGPHKHIIGFKGQRDDGLLLERALHGSIAHFLKDYTPTWQQSLAWARQVTEAVAATHNARVIHCDISVNNVLVDHNLTVKLCDFKDNFSSQTEPSTRATLPARIPNHLCLESQGNISPTGRPTSSPSAHCSTT